MLNLLTYNKINFVIEFFIQNYRGYLYIAGWSSPVARQAHNLKVVGSNPTPATKIINEYC